MTVQQRPAQGQPLVRALCGRSLIAMAIAGVLTVQAAEDVVWITLDPATAKSLQTLNQQQGIYQEITRPAIAADGSLRPVVAKITEPNIGLLSEHIHEKLHRCGGFIAHASEAEAMAATANPISLAVFTPPALSQQAVVPNLLNLLNQAGISQVISDLSGFTNRYYTTTAGAQSADWIANRWGSLSSGKSWATVSRVTHSGYNQKSVQLTLLGSEKPDEVIVIGGHLDSIISGGVSESTRAPGADDDASGIATMTEVIRVLMEQNIRPKRTIRFYGYAAEEVGLRGSKDIATSAKNSATNVIAAMQLDMTNYKGSAEDIVLMTDYTNASLNSYLQSLLTTYQPALRHSTDQCGYGCSDHASWHNAGYAAAMPFEARMNASNPRIHTVNDTLTNSDSTAAHALKFAKLALSFAVELGNSTSGGGGGGGTSGEFTNLAAAKGAWVYKTISVPSGATSLTIDMSGGTGDGDLYVRYNANPTTSSYSCRPYKAGNTESCVLTNPQAGNWVVGVRAYSAFSGITVRWTQR